MKVTLKIGQRIEVSLNGYVLRSGKIARVEGQRVLIQFRKFFRMKSEWVDLRHVDWRTFHNGPYTLVFSNGVKSRRIDIRLGWRDRVMLLFEDFPSGCLSVFANGASIRAVRAKDSGVGLITSELESELKEINSLIRKNHFIDSHHDTQ